MATSRVLCSCLAALLLALPARADEAGWRRAIAAGEAAYRSGDHAEASFAFSTALKNAESFGPFDSRLATSLGWLAETYRLQGRLAEAEPLLERALAIREKVLGPNHPSTHLTRHNLTVLQKSLGREPGSPAAPATATAPSAAPSAPVIAPLKPKPEPVVVVAPPQPKPEPVVVAPPKPAPKPEAVVVPEPPKPAPIVEAPRPKPEPAIVVAPKPAHVVVPEPPKPATVVIVEPVKPIAVIEAPKPKPEPAVVALSKPEPAAIPAPPRPAPIIESPKPRPEPVVVAPPPAPKPAATEEANPLAAPLGALFRLFEPARETPAAPKPQSQPIPPKPEPVAVVRAEAPAPRPAAPIVAPAPVVQARPVVPTVPQAAAQVAAVTPAPAMPVASAVPAVPPSPAQLARQDVESQLAALGAPSRANVARAFDLMQRPRESTPLPLADAQSLLGGDEALLSYVIGERSSAVAVVRRDRAEWHALDTDRTRLAAEVRQFRRQLDPAADTSVRGQQPPLPGAVAHQLYRTLVAPAAGTLDGATHLVVVGDGPLQALPFAALLTEPPPADANAKRAWLARRYATTLLPGESALRRIRSAGAASATRAFAGFGDPQLRGESTTAATNAAPLFARGDTADLALLRNLSRLPDSRYVLDAMSDILDGSANDVRLQAEATEESVKAARLADYRVLAFGSYGLMAGEFPGRAEPGIVLTPPRFASEADDGVLTASEVARLKLDAELVVLTAGGTGSSDGTPGAEGLARLAGAFIEAGSRALIVPHWTVQADSTLKLVSRALRERARGAGNAEALRRAMLALMDGEDRPAYAHPMYWAQLAVVGEGARPSSTARAATTPR